MRTFIVLLAFCFSSAAFASYNSNIKGELEGVYVYTDGDYIYFRFKNQPTTHASCDPTYFVISEDIPLERRQMLLSRLLMAYASKEQVNIGYDKSGNCVHGHIRVHRVG